MFENGLSTNLLNLVYELSKKADVTIKTPVGNSEEAEINGVIMQGETLSGVICTNSMDKMSKECDLEKIKYKNKVEIPKLGYVDDIADITECGEKTEEMNKYTMKEMNERKLQMSTDKCAMMHIEKNTRNYKNLTLLKKNHVPGTSLKIKVVIKLSKLACVLANLLNLN